MKQGSKINSCSLLFKIKSVYAISLKTMVVKLRCQSYLKLLSDFEIHFYLFVCFLKMVGLFF